MLRFSTLFLFTFLFILNVGTSQVTTNTSSGLSATYPTLDAAILALNNAIITSPVVITVNGNETAPSSGYTITAQGTAINTITIDGNQYLITASATHPMGTFNDAIIKLVGADYVTLENFVLRENPLATNAAPTTNTVTEWGIALLAESRTNGSQNNIIQNNNISLRVSAVDRNTFGIYSNVSHTSTSISNPGNPSIFSGTNSNNKIYGNNISKISIGIAFVGSVITTNPDQYNEIGGSNDTLGNSISDWGNSNTSAIYTEVSLLKCAIYAKSQINDLISFNTIASNYITTNANGTVINGIEKNNVYANPSGTSNITNNTITIKALDHFLQGIYCSGTTQVGTTLNIENNKLLKWTLNVTNTAVSINGIYNGTSVSKLNISNNLIRGITTKQTNGTFTGIENQGAVIDSININNNNFGNDEGSAIKFSGITSITYLISNTNGSSTCQLSISGNKFDKIEYLISTSNSLTFINNTASNVLGRSFNQNVFKNIIINSTSGVTFFRHGANIPINGTLSINNNAIVGNFTKLGASGDIKILDTGSGFSASANAIITVNNNNFSGITSTGTSLFSGITYNLGASFTATGNIISNLILGGTSITGNIGLSGSGTISNISNNIISNITTPFSFVGISSGQTGSSATLDNNQIFNVNAGTNLSGLSYGGSHNTATIKNNKIYNLTTTNGNVVGISCVETNSLTTVSTTTSIFKNKIFGLSGNGATNIIKGLIIGVSSSNNLQCTVSNNYIGDLRAPNSNVDNAVIAVNMTTSSDYTDANFYFNTIYLDAVSTGATFGSSIITSNGFARLDLRNNIFVNNSTPNGTGLNVVYKSMPLIVANYKANCGNNLLYAGVPNAQRLIYSGTGNEQTLQAFQARVYPRDNQSVSELPTFLSLTGTSVDYLHLDTTAPTKAESGGAQIAGINNDFDGDIRSGNPGYLGAGSLPDIGADEGDFTLLDTNGPLISYMLLPTASSLSNVNLINVVISDVSGINTTAGLKPRVYFKKKSHANTFIDNTNATDGWKYTEATGSISPFDFVIDYSLLNGPSVSIGDTIQYFVIAQDLASIPNAGLESGLLTLMPTSVDLDASHFPLFNIINNYLIKTGIEGTKTVCNTGCDFNSLTNDGGIFEAVNSSLVTNNMTIEIAGDLTAELGIHPLNQYNVGKTILIKPVGGLHRRISGTAANGKPLIDLNGADFVTIDGINSEGDSLTIVNLSVSSTTQTSTLRFTNGASDNVIARCSLLGSSTVSLESYGGVILFNNSTKGNKNNIVQNCNVGPAGANLPVSLITATSGQISTGNTVLNCNLYDFFSPTKSSSGIYINNDVGSQWTINNNKFYQSTTKTFTLSGYNYHYGLYMTGGNGHTINDNIIGYASPSETGTYSVVGVSNSAFISMYLSLGTTNTSTIQGNKVRNLSFTGTSIGEMTLLSVFGLANVGTITPNVFGDTLVNGNIIYTRNSNSSGYITGMLISQSFTNAVVKNNIFGGIQASNIGVSGCDFNAITCNNSATAEISNNIIGGNLQNSLQCNSTAISTLTGISYTSNKSSLISNNIIRNLSATSTVVSNAYGIDFNNTSNLPLILQNKIYGLSGLGSTGSGNVYGINLNSSTSLASTIDGNFIHTLHSEAAGKSLIGINIANGLNKLSNNIIRLGLKEDGSVLTLPCTIYGILENAGTNRIYHNTILIAGQGVDNGVGVTSAIRRVLGTGGDIRNNIFSNQRSNTTIGGSHYNIYVDALLITPIINKNLYYNTGGNGNLFGRRQSVDFATFNAWKATTIKDVNSFSDNPSFALPLGNSNTFDLHILKDGNAIAENNADPIAEVNSDFDGQSRSVTTPDIGADEGDFISPVIAYAPLGDNKITINRSLSNVNISAQNGINNSSGFKPRVYFKKTSDANDLTGWKYTETTSVLSPYTFNIDYTLLNSGLVDVGDTIQYFVVAEDLSMPSRAAIENGFTNIITSTVNLVSTHFPITGNINSFMIRDTLQGNITVCNFGCDFTSLTNDGGLFNTINNQVVTGNINATILSDLLAETGIHSLNQLTPGFQMSIKPDGGIARIISGTVSGKGLISLSGADNVTIDGLNTGGNSLTISNSSPSSTSSTSTIEMKNDATSNIIKNCTVLGSSIVTNGGVIVVSYSLVSNGTGNDNNEIRKCNIGPSGSNLPFYGINIYGSNYNLRNENIVIDSNIIYDYFSATNVSSGIYIGGNTTNINITNNRFYQSVARTQTGAIHSAIYIVNSSGYYNVIGNIIGGSDSNNNGIYSVNTSDTYDKVYGIYISANAVESEPSAILNNKIKNISVSGNRSGANSSTPFACIYINSGRITINNNIIGDMASTSSITYTSTSTSQSEIGGIYSYSPYSIITNNNKIGGITVTNSSTGASSFFGIRVEGILTQDTWECLNNEVGGDHPQSIQNNATNTSSQLNGIYSSTIFNANVRFNKVKNFNKLSIAASFNTYGGIRLQKTFTNNTTFTVTDNEIFNLASSAISGTSTVSGIYVSNGSTTSVSNIERNIVHSIPTINPAAEVVGIYMTNGTYNVINNAIRLGINPDGTSLSVSAIMTGLYESGTTIGNYYNNTVYIGGSVTGTGSSRCYFTNKGLASGIFRNNIFQNDRSNSVAGGYHSCITSLSNITFNTDNNLYHTPGTDGKVAYIVSTTRLTLDAWRNANLKDAGSFYGLPNLLNPTGDTSNFSLNINSALFSPAEGNGIFAGNVTNDILNQTRTSLTPNDIGAYAGNFMGGDLIGPDINFNDLSNDTISISRAMSSVIITDLNGVESSLGLKPRLYYKKSTDPNDISGWKFVEANNVTSPFNFTIDYTLLNTGSILANDIIQYFVIAQDALVVPNIGKKDAIFLNTPTSVALSASHFPISGSLKSYTIKTKLIGTKTICASGCDFNSITKVGGAFDFINNNIVTGNLLLNITSDLPTENGAVALNQFASPHTVTLRPEGGPRVITNTGSTYFIALNGADNVIIDGSLSNTVNTLCPLSKATRDLTLINSNINLNISIFFISNATNNPATNNIIRNCNIQGNSTSKTTYGILSVNYSDFGVNQNNYNQFINNQITKVQLGINSKGQSINTKNENTTINLNDINLTAPENLSTAGIYLGNENNANIIGNNISNVNSVSGSVVGISLGILPTNTVTNFTGEEVTNSIISDNKINDITIQGDGSAFGITIASVISNNSSINECHNNVLYNIKTTSATSNDFISGILLGGGSAGTTKIFHNTIRLNGIASFSAPSFCIAIGGKNPSLNVKNNIFVNEMTSTLGKNYTIGFAYEDSFSGFLSNRNDFYTSSSPLATKGGFNNSPSGDISNFTDYKTATGKDANSKNILPDFVSPSDLHLTLSTQNIFNLDGKGEAVGVTNDIDCDIRNSTPDIGADEIAGCNYPTITSINADINPISCSGNTSNLTVNGILNDASQWKWYAGSCGGTFLGSGSSITVMPTSSTTYYVRGEGGCASASECTSVSINIASPIVLNTNDSGSGSLRAAIVCAGDGGTITFDPSVLGSADTIMISSAALVINKSLNMNQTAGTKVKIKTTGAHSIFNIQNTKTLNISYFELFLNPTSPNILGRGILNNGTINADNISIFEKAANLIGSGSTIQSEAGSKIQFSSSNKIVNQ